MPQEIKLVQAQPTLIAVRRVNTTFAQWPNQWKAALDEVYSTTKSHKIQTLGINVMVYHPRGGGHAEIECGVQVASQFEALGNVICSVTPKGCAATITHVGPYQKMRESYQALDAWCRENGHKQIGTSWEIYGHWNNDASKLRTELFYLLETNASPA